MEPKITTLLPTCFEIIAIHLVCRCSLLVWRRSLLKKGAPCDLFWPRHGSAPGRIWPKNNNTCKGPWVVHLYQVSSKSIKRFWRRSRNCEKFTDGRRTVHYDNSSLEPRWAKKSLISLTFSDPCRGTLSTSSMSILSSSSSSDDAFSCVPVPDLSSSSSPSSKSYHTTFNVWWMDNVSRQQHSTIISESKFGRKFYKLR